jgi:uncharacterized protein (DUF433 family)
MTSYSIDYIISDPDVQRGRPRINGTGITVHHLAEDHRNGKTVEWMVESFDLTPSQVYAALAYYYDHKEQIDQELQEDEERTQQFIEQNSAAASENWRRIEERLNAIRAEGKKNKPD